MAQQFFIHQVDPGLASPEYFDISFNQGFADIVGALFVQGKDVVIESDLFNAEPFLEIDNLFNDPFRALRPEFAAENWLGAVGAAIGATATGDDSRER